METRKSRMSRGVLNLEDRLDPKADEQSFIERYTDWYFATKSFEKSGKLYETLGVRPFKKLIMATIGELFKIIGINKTKGTYFIGKERNRYTLKQYELTARLNELIHAPQIAWNSYELAKNFYNGDCQRAMFWGSLLLVNTYCTMLQRYNRTYAIKRSF